MINNISTYLKTKDWDCNFEYSMKDGQPSIAFKPSLYKFNAAEITGNALLAPIAWVVKTFEESNAYKYSIGCCDCRMTFEPIVKAALVIVGIFAGIIGLIGLAVKKIGEYANPNSAHRQNAMSKLYQINDKLSAMTGQTIKDVDDILSVFADAMFKTVEQLQEGNRLESLFTAKILKPKFGITDSDLSLMRPAHDHFSAISKGFKLGSMSETEKAEHQARIVKIEPITAQWQQLWQKVGTPGTDDATIKAELKDLVGSDPETEQAALKFMQGIRANQKNKADLDKLINEYNEALKPMLPAATVTAAVSATDAPSAAVTANVVLSTPVPAATS